jgi:uncharacterized protein DUF2281
MLKTKVNIPEDVLDRLKELPEDMQPELLDFMDFLIQKSRKSGGAGDVQKAVSAVEDTWGSIRLDRGILKYIAEDKELEYEV